MLEQQGGQPIGSVAISLDGHTIHGGLLEDCRNLLGALQEASCRFSTDAGLPDCSIAIRITDDFASEVQSRSRDDSTPFTTDRYGGGVAGITLPSKGDSTKRRVFVNAAVFTMDETWAVSALPLVLAHEVAHCLMELCRGQAGAPKGFKETPADLLEIVDHAAVTVCDEYLADELAKDLSPALRVTVATEEGESDTSDRVMLAVYALGQMRDALDEHVYPKLRDRVLRYLETGEDLHGMVDDMTIAIPSALILSAHYRAAVQDLPLTDEAELVTKHPATRLYLQPFWDRVGPVLDERLDRPLWRRFAEYDQRTIEQASEAILGFWAALGMRLEPLGAGGVFVHVDAPDDI